MITFRRILFPVDFSKQDHEVAPFVKAMAERFQSEVILLHVAEVPPAWYGFPDTETPEPAVNLKALLNDRRELLRAHLSAELADVCVHRMVEVGDPANEIATCIQEQKADLVMMPTHGLGSFRRFLLGSVTAKVLHETICPVWTGVHTGQLWSQGQHRWQRFLCAVDAGSKDAPLLRWAVQFSSEQKAELQVIHVVPGPASVLPGQEPASLRGFLLDMTEQRLSKLQADADTNVDIAVLFGKIEDVVRDAALTREADLVLIGRGVLQGMLGRLRSSAYGIIREAPCPVISI